MWEFLTDYGLFLAKAATVLLGVLVAAIGVAASSRGHAALARTGTSRCAS